ncbi:pyridoxal phosphate-dependent aminotransferase [Clostridium cylindrosporum]|uniref:Aminotransferase n=1 Tax=Clostridium cylindrosporum DSM 605 TaxID=1121307 RepID=A0A0J8DFV5_CLOCY|nr:pyridoxal phosphate-dependent aminotransferase [Clostridium cylindrosporum]KMT23043.1 aspartate aminotransferase [Clostridium cylindrosporum DSM 605]
MELSRRAKDISASVTLAITAKAKKLKSEGVDIISFGAGEPDFDTPANILKAAEDALKQGLTRYTAASGISELKAAICEKLNSDNNLSYKEEQIVISNGAKHSLYNALFAICNESDEVIVPLPYWVSYPELVKLVGAKPVFVETPEENDFKYIISELKAAITNKTKAIILNSPNNPTGAVYSEEELKEIAKMAIENDIFIISDEIYEKLVYNDTKHISIASLSDEIKERTIVVNGVSKAYAMTGWRIGYTASNSEVSKIMSNFQSHATSNPNSIAQYASVEAINGPQEQIEVMRVEFEKRRDYMVDRVNAIPGLSCKKPKGAFYVMVNISSFIGKTINDKKISSSVDFCDALIDVAKVAAIPGAGFGSDNYIRLSYATSMKNIEEGLNRIENFVK